MAQCHGYLLLTSLPPCPHFFLLTAIWSQGCVLSSGWKGDAHAEFSAVLSWRCKGGSGFVPVLSRHRAVPQTGILASGTAGTEGSEIQGQILLKLSVQEQEGQGQSCLQGLRMCIANDASCYVCLTGNVPGTSI